MKEIWIILKREFKARVGSRAFIIGTLLFPIIMTALIALPMLAGGGGSQRTLALINEAPPEIGDRFVEILTANRSADDNHYRVERIAGSATDHLDELNRRVIEKQIDGYVVLPRDLMTSNELLYRARSISSPAVNKDLQLAANRAVQAQRLRDAGMEPVQLMALVKPVRINSGQVMKEKIGRGSTTSSFLLAYGLAFFAYFTFITQGIGLLRSVLEEKTNRISEVMVSSTRPGYLMAGKILGAGSAALIQVCAWILMLRGAIGFLNARNLIGVDVLNSLSVDPSTAIAYALYFVLGFFLYAAVFAALGSMVNSEQEAQSIQSFALLPLIVPLLFIRKIVDDPLGQTATTLGLVPFTSPIAMPIRMASETLSFAQLSTSIALLAVGLIAVTWIAGRIYRIGILSTGKKPTMAELMKWIKAA